MVVASQDSDWVLSDNSRKELLWGGLSSNASGPSRVVLSLRLSG